MRISLISISVVLIGVTGPLSCTYRDLKRDIDGYSPPAMLRQPARAPDLSAKARPDAFEAKKKEIEEARERWVKAVDEKSLTLEDTAIPQVIVDAAAEDTQTLALLQSRFSLVDIHSLILLRNPSIKGAADRFQAALAGFDQITQLDEILRQYAAFTEGVMPGVGPMRGMDDQIRLKFPFPGVMALKGQVAEKNVEAEKQALDLVRRDVIAQAGKSYWNLIYTHRALRITRDLLDRLNHLESVATTRYGAGKTSYQDVIKIRIGREKLAEQLTTLKEQRVNLEAELLALMDLRPGQAVGIPVTTTPVTSLPRLDDLYPLALEKRQELNRMRAMVGKMERMVEMAETMIQPAFTQNYSLYTDESILQAGSAGMQPSFATRVSPARGQGLPKNVWFGTQDAYLMETRRKLDALKADLVDAEARTRLMVRTAWYELDKALRERNLYRNRLLGLSQTALDVSTRGYESGNVSFADAINSYTDWLDINLASAKRNSDVGIARAELERRVGGRLP